ncbi:50S ribosomal protein L18 [Chloroflexi bacterium TSY]|nr:50S ribosomal protein L18 [Chloroflexi bacterium TSY]
MAKETRTQARRRRHARVRKKIMGTGDRPRLNVYRSINHIYAQIIDDVAGDTLVSASTLDKNLRSELAEKSPIEQAKSVGLTVAQRAKEHGIEVVVFDRGGYPYHGRVKALAEGSREGGLIF